jgi:hypothetical protein
VILGLGDKYEVVEVDVKKARSDLLLYRRAIYASPFDIEFYKKFREVLFLFCNIIELVVHKK